MKILMTGATGLIGKRLAQILFEAGHEIHVVSRNKITAQNTMPFPVHVIQCDLLKTPLKPEDFSGVDAVIHLLGESIDGRWTNQKKKEILGSRVLSSQNLLQNAPTDLKAIISTSAVGFYGDTTQQEVDESSSQGSDFLAEVCAQWEEPFLAWQKKSNTRVVILRLGTVFSYRGGALAKLISLFQKNLGAALGSGKQWMSFISLEDVIRVYQEALTNVNYKGVINVTTSQPVQNKDFTQKMCEILQVMKLPNVPGFVLKTLLGEMSQIVLASSRVQPTQLKRLGFHFKYPNLEAVLEKELLEFKNGKSFLYSEQYLPLPIEKVFSFFSDAKNLEKLTPPTLKFHIDQISTDTLQAGTLIDYKLKIHQVPAKWRTLIEVWNPPYQFVDLQLKGPYSLWHHTHTFTTLGEGTLMIDEVRFQVPLGSVGRLVAGTFVESDVKKIFDYRRQVIADLLF